MGKIIDVSANNGNIDWPRVAADGVTDAIIRLSLGYNTKDQLADNHAQGASRVGIRVSYYHFAYPDSRTGGSIEGDARNEARYFSGLFNAGLMPSPYWLAVDLETWEHGADSPLTKTEYLQWVIAFLDEVYSITSTVCMIYSNRPYLNNHLPANHSLGTVPLWIANYNQVNAPPLPNGWSSYNLWQFTETGVVNGVNGLCDISRLYYESLMKILKIKYSKTDKGKIQQARKFNESSSAKKATKTVSKKKK